MYMQNTIAGAYLHLEGRLVWGDRAKYRDKVDRQVWVQWHPAMGDLNVRIGINDIISVPVCPKLAAGSVKRILTRVRACGW